MLLDLWNIESLTQRFMEVYNLTGIQMCNILEQLHLNPNLDSVSIFCEETGIKLDALDVANNIEFVGKIVSTTTDNFDYLKQVGLVPVDFLLENDSPISQHLRKYGLEIKPSEHKLIYNEKIFYIPSDVTDCKCCAYGYTKCRFEDKELFCTFLRAIYMLGIKLYNNAEIEMFLIASKDEMLRYSTVKEYPEILYTIDSLMKNFFKKELGIGREWAKQKQTSYIVTINVKYNDMSYRSGYIDFKCCSDAVDTYYKYKKYCINAYSYTEQVPKCFWDNVWLIQTCLNTICSHGKISGKICAGVKNNVKFPYDKLKIELI